jgi:hypothetical protein
MVVFENIILGILGTIISALIVGIISLLIAKYQIRSLKEDYTRQLKSYENGVKRIEVTSKDNLKTMYVILEKQEKRILDLEEKIIVLIKASRENDLRKLDLIERDLNQKQRSDSMRILRGLGEALGII